MKILQLCCKPPRPTVDGGCIAMDNISSSLLKLGHELKIISIATHKHPFKPEEIEKSYIDQTNFEAVFVNTKINLVDAFSALVTADSYNISRFFSADFDLHLMRLLKREKFDFVHLESLFMTPYINTIRRCSKAKIVLRSHNLEYMIWKRMAESSGNPAKKVYLSLLANQLKKYEINVIQHLDGIAAISHKDAAKYKAIGNAPVATIPFGVDIENYTPVYDGFVKNPNFFHLGSMDWKPNLEGISWMLNSVWTETQFNNKLVLAGRKMPNWVTNNTHRVENVGEVSNAQEFITSNGILVVPLLSAGGIRIKIIEGMALGKTIISTSIGAEGINYTNGKDIIIANNKDEFINAFERVLNNPQMTVEIGKNARCLIETSFNNDLLAKQLIDFYQSLLS